MRIIKLNAIDSTNSYLRRLSNEGRVENYTVVTAKYQTQGRGQMGSTWSSEHDKNLIFSVFKGVSWLDKQHPFLISMVASLAVLKALQKLGISKLSIKWPNDILSENKKICGILIENVIKQNGLDSTIIGVGLNVNQTDFENLPKASSLKAVTGIVFNLDEVLHLILDELKHAFEVLKKGSYKALKEEYENYLFRKNKPSSFLDAEGLIFTGIIKSVTLEGSLQMLLEDNITKEFDLKEISLMY
ncbi:biotin--[acetyl-CoA-carboxylase] ligase [Flavobacteriaceae bacterium XHP0103]|uniref:biotin--[acetyl-CoA-carboxylase] ligase n=1 Tax=Marixanthotalea marina TaxID=2844359 RepID=UPI002989ED4D|nr:biotin--[acetyl-CoA-carboxylase] ligase [Marixanthotalea marina]MBU3821116.1 biotin--[acetyl-CoA-carboxylase] ligase [Marixanthotalea marina]